MFLSDIISGKKEALENELRENICACAGCCDGGCYFRNKQGNWLNSVMLELETSLGLTGGVVHQQHVPVDHGMEHRSGGK